MSDISKYLKVKDPQLIGEYPAAVNTGGGYVWDFVLEYRVGVTLIAKQPVLKMGKTTIMFLKHMTMRLNILKTMKGAKVRSL
jgi:hypothetical protein